MRDGVAKNLPALSFCVCSLKLLLLMSVVLTRVPKISNLYRYSWIMSTNLCSYIDHRVKHIYDPIKQLRRSFSAKTKTMTFRVLNTLLNKNLSFNPLGAKPTKWSNTLKPFVGKLSTNYLRVSDHFVGLALKGLR